MQAKSSYPLTFAKEKTKIKLERIKCNKEVAKHLEDLGLIIGIEFVVLSKNSKGIIIKVKDSKFALDSNLCKNIFISEVQQEKDNCYIL